MRKCENLAGGSRLAILLLFNTKFLTVMRHYVNIEIESISRIHRVTYTHTKHTHLYLYEFI